MPLFKRKKKSKPYDEIDPVYARYQTILDLVIGLTKSELNKMKDVMDSVWDSYEKKSKIRQEDNFLGDYMIPTKEIGYFKFTNKKEKK